MYVYEYTLTRWLDQLGLLALSGQRVQCRQTLLGSDYGLIDANSLEGTPDFWVSYPEPEPPNPNPNPNLN